jgi:transposase
VEEFATLGNAANRQALDSGKAGNQQFFWERVASAFASEEASYGILFFMDDQVISENGHIDPGKIVPHSWKKLKEMWRNTNSQYRAALNKFTQSGTHDHDFYNFCGGIVETYYLRKYLEIRPNTTAMVIADLPEEIAMSTDGTTTTLSSASKSNKKKARSNEFMDAVREYQEGINNSDYNQQRLVSLRKDDTRKDEERKEKKHKSLFDEWEKLTSNIRSLREDLSKVVDNEMRQEIEDDIKVLRARKNELSIALGYK